MWRAISGIATPCYSIAFVDCLLAFYVFIIYANKDYYYYYWWDYSIYSC